MAWTLFFDPTNPHFIHDFIPAVFNNVKNWGYRAVKWDTLPRSLDLYDDYHDKFYDPSVTSETALRNVLAKAHEVLGETFLCFPVPAKTIALIPHAEKCLMRRGLAAIFLTGRNTSNMALREC